MGIRQETISEVIRELYIVAGKLNRLEKRGVDFGDGLKLHTAEIHAIEAIGHQKDITPSELCRYFEVTRGAVSQVIAKLERKGLIVKDRNPLFGKEKNLSLTAAGWKIFHWHDAFHQEMDGDFFRQLQGVDEKRVAEFMEFLNIIASRLDRYLKRDST